MSTDNLCLTSFTPIVGGDLFSRIMFSDDTFTEADISGFVEQILKGPVASLRNEIL